MVLQLNKDLPPITKQNINETKTWFMIQRALYRKF